MPVCIKPWFIIPMDFILSSFYDYKKIHENTSWIVKPAVAPDEYDRQWSIKTDHKE